MKHFIISLFNLKVSDISAFDSLSVGDETFIYITLKKKPTRCPTCNTYTSSIHDYRTRTINHPILNSRRITLIYNQRRYSCKECGKSFSEHNPFANPGSRISRYTVMRIMKELKKPYMTFSMVADNTSTSKTTVCRIFDRHAGINTTPFPTLLCIDEIYTIKYKQKVYACVLVDFASKQIYDLLPGRTKYLLSDYFSKIDKKTRYQVKYVSMDMWKTYRDVCQIYFPKAKICVDSFHVISLINRAFTKVRIRVMNSFSKNSDEYYLIKKYTWLLNKNYADVPSWKHIKLYRYISLLGTKHTTTTDLLAAILSIDAELEISYMLKDDYIQLNKNATTENIDIMLDKYLEDLKIFNIDEFQPVYKTLKKWRQEIINSFDLYDGRRISNGPIESVNSRINKIKNTGNGYTNFDRFRRRVLYSLNNNSTIKF